MKDRKCSFYYVLGFLMVLGLKIYGDRAGSDELLWILRPTAWWSGLLGGISFVYERGVGYVNHSLRFIIAPACAGLKFWMISSLMLICSFVHRWETEKKRLCWTLLCVLSAFLFTVFVNGIRIVLSIDLPLILRDTGGIAGRLTKEQLHTAIGTLVYFSALLGLYRIGDGISGRLGETGRERTKVLSSKLLPVFWYLGPVLGLPLLSRIACRDFENLAGYELPVSAVCGGVLFPLGVWTVVKSCAKITSWKRAAGHLQKRVEGSKSDHTERKRTGTGCEDKADAGGNAQMPGVC